MESAAKGMSIWVLGAVLTLTIADASAYTATTLANGVTPEQMAQSLLSADSGITIDSVQYQGAAAASGEFTGGEVFGIAQGIVLTSGSATSFGNNANNVAGSPLLDAIENCNSCTHDASVLTIVFTPTSSTIQFNYVFASEEYPVFVGTEFNDVFGFFVNGQNQALIPGTTTPVEINNINCGDQFSTTGPFCNLFTDNRTGNHGFTPDQLGGWTNVFALVANVNPGQQNTLTLAIADTSDFALDSAAFIQAGSLSVCGGVNEPPCGGATLTITKTADTTVLTSDPINYTITVTNTGAGPADGTLVEDLLPAELTGATWTCAASGGAACPHDSGTDNIDQTIATFPAGGSIVFVLTASVAANPPGSIVNIAAATPPSGGTCADQSTPPCQASATVSAPLDVGLAEDPAGPIALVDLVAVPFQVQNVSGIDAANVQVTIEPATDVAFLLDFPEASCTNDTDSTGAVTVTCTAPPADSVSCTSSTCTIAVLPAGATLRLAAVMNANAVTAHALVNAPGDTNPDNDKILISVGGF